MIGLATSRVFARLPPGSVQSAASASAADWTPYDKQSAVAWLPTPPQPPTARPRRHHQRLRWQLWTA